MQENDVLRGKSVGSVIYGQLPRDARPILTWPSIGAVLRTPPASPRVGQRSANPFWRREPVFGVLSGFFHGIFIANPFDRSALMSRWSLPDGHPSLGQLFSPPFFARPFIHGHFQCLNCKQGKLRSRDSGTFSCMAPLDDVKSRRVYTNVNFEEVVRTTSGIQDDCRVLIARAKLRESRPYWLAIRHCCQSDLDLASCSILRGIQ